MIKILLVLLLLSGCATTPITPLFKPRGRCLEIAERVEARYHRQGKEAVAVHGLFHGERHAWVEYKKGDKWYVHDEAIWYSGLGFTREEHGDYEYDGEVTFIPKHLTDIEGGV